MKLGPVTKRDKRNLVTKKLTMTPCQQIVMPLSSFRLKANLTHTGIWIPDAWSLKLTFSSKGRIQAVWEAHSPVWAPKLWHPKNTFQVLFFQLYFNKKC